MNASPELRRHSILPGRSAMLLAVLLLVCAAAFAQQEPATIKIEVQQVLVPVVVTDRAGHHVTGLRESDFKVYEDGVEQPIVFFGTELSSNLPAAGIPLVPGAATVADPPPAASASTPASSSPLAASLRPASVRRTYLVLIDSLFLNFDSLNRLRKALPKLFADEQGSDAQYALVALGRDLRIVRSVTRKPEEILAAANSDALVRAMRESGGGNFAGQQSQLRTMLEQFCRQCNCMDTAAPTGRTTFMEDSAICESLMAKMESWVSTTARERAQVTQVFLAKLADIIRRTGKQPGKRILIMASDGFDLRPGDELYHLIATYTNRPTFPLNNPADRLQGELDEVAQAATANDVVIYTVDTRGLPPPAAEAFSAEVPGGRFVRRDAGHVMNEMVSQVSLTDNSKQDTMAKLADVTGGVFFHGNSDLAKGMHQAFADEREYYVLAYNAPASSDDTGFRKIRVEIKDRKLKIRAKQGYWAMSPVTKP